MEGETPKRCPTCGRKLKTAASAPEKGSWSVPEALRGLALYEQDGRLCVLWTQLYGAWRAAYPTLNIAREIAAAHAWEVANPQRRKTPRGRAKFLTAWLERCQNGRGGKAPVDEEAQRRAGALEAAQRRKAEEAKRAREEAQPEEIADLLGKWRARK